MSDQVIIDQERCKESPIHPGVQDNLIDEILTDEQYGNAMVAIPAPSLRVGRTYRDLAHRPIASPRR
jgi:hypothetical protein